MTRRATASPLVPIASRNFLSQRDIRAMSRPKETRWRRALHKLAWSSQSVYTWCGRTERRIGPGWSLPNSKAKKWWTRTQWQRMTCKVDTWHCPNKSPERREMRQTEARQLNRLRDLLSRGSRAEAWRAGKWRWRDESPTEPQGWRKLWPVARSKRRLRNMEVKCPNFQSGHSGREDKAEDLRASPRSRCRGQLAGWTERRNCSASLWFGAQQTYWATDVDQCFLQESFPSVILLSEVSAMLSIWLCD